MLFQPDYAISWDFSDKDLPCVGIARIRANRKGTALEVDVIETFNTETGIVSLRQLIEEFNIREEGNGK